MWVCYGGLVSGFGVGDVEVDLGDLWFVGDGDIIVGLFVDFYCVFVF